MISRMSSSCSTCINIRDNTWRPHVDPPVYIEWLITSLADETIGPAFQLSDNILKTGQTLKWTCRENLNIEANSLDKKTGTQWTTIGEYCSNNVADSYCTTLTNESFIAITNYLINLLIHAFIRSRSLTWIVPSLTSCTPTHLSPSSSQRLLVMDCVMVVTSD